MKRSVLTVLGVCLVLACARRESPATPKKETLYRHLGGDPATLDPVTTTEDFGLQVEEMIFRPLVGLDSERRPVPALATSWTISPDGLIYEFRLDPGALWEDGSRVTSDDVSFTIARARDPKVPAFTWRSGFDGLAAIETPDPATVRFRFEKPYAERLFAFSLPIVSRGAYARAKSATETDRKPEGSGPYRLESWEPNQKITLVRRSDAAGAAAHFERMVFRILPASAVWFQAGVRGDLDEFRVLRDQRAGAEASPEFTAKNRILKVPQFLVVLVLWNCKSPVLSDARVRRALALAWPRQEAAKRLYPPDGAALISGPYPAGAPENAPDVAPPTNDPAESARLLDAAGFALGADGWRRRAGKRVRVELLYPTGATIYANIGEILRSGWEKVGVEAIQRPLDWAAHAQRADAGEFDAQMTARLFLPPNVDPFPYYHSSQAPPVGKNLGSYRNADADRAMEAAQRELDPAKRLELYRQVHRLFAGDPPADFLWGAEQYWGISKRLEGVQTSPSGLFHFLPGPLGWKPVG